MAGVWTNLYQQDFTSVSSVTVTHNTDRVQVAVLVTIGGEVRNDLIDSITIDSVDPRNKLVVTLTSSQSGTVNIADADFAWANLPSPEESSQLEDAIHVDVAGEIRSITEKTTPVSADILMIEDSADLSNKKKIRIGNLPSSGGGVFGDSYQSVVDRTFRSTTGTSFSQVQRLTTSSLDAGTYRIEWNYVWSYNATNTNFKCRVQLDNTTELYEQTNGGAGAYDYQQQEPKDRDGSGDGGTDQRHVAAFWADKTLTAGVHVIDIDVASSSGGILASIHLSTIAIYRVS